MCGLLRESAACGRKRAEAVQQVLQLAENLALTSDEPPGIFRHHIEHQVAVHLAGLDLGVEAYDSLKEAVRLEPESAPFNYALGAVALHRRDPGEAIPYFKKYIALRPEDMRGTFAIGAAAFQAHDFALARVELQKAAARAETAAGANYFLARIAREEGDLDEGLRLARKAVEVDPRYAEAYAELGILYMRKRETDKAEQALGRCLELDPDNYLGNYHLLMLYQRTKDGREEAQARRFEELKQRREEKADEFRRVIDVRPY